MRRSSGAIPAYLPRPARVLITSTGAPAEVEGRAIAAVRESWLVEDRWWTERPLRRRYWEVVTECGRNIVIFRDLECAGANSWFIQR
jgi:hypothetical protein